MNAVVVRNLLVGLLLTVFLSSCAENLPQDIPQSYTAPKLFTFDVSYDRAWPKIVRAISSGGRITTLDKSSGLIVTEYLTVNKNILTMFETAMFGRTYKNSYSVNVFEDSPGRTSVMVKSNLMMEQFVLYNRERHVEWFEAYMRQDLFSKICNTLYRDVERCESFFPYYKDLHGVEPTVPSDTATLTTNGQAMEITEGNPLTVSNNTVQDAQNALREAGYSPGMIDGIMGRKTRSALQHFQADQGIQVSGELDQITLQALGIR